MSEAAWTQGHALQVGVQRKLASNLPNCRSMGLTCIPLVAETLGGLAEDFISTIWDIGKSIGQVPTETKPQQNTSLEGLFGVGTPLCSSTGLAPALDVHTYKLNKLLFF